MRYYSTTAGAMVLQSAIADSDTTIVVDTTAGLPVTFPYTLLLDYGANSEEVVDVTAAAGTTLTVERAKDGTVAQAHAFGAVIRHGVTARDHRESREHEADTTAHGIAGDVVGTTDTQTLDNKTIQPAGDHPALTVRDVLDNVEPPMEVLDSSGARVGSLSEVGLQSLRSAAAVATLLFGSAINLYKATFLTQVKDDIHAIVANVSGTPTGRFLRLMSGATELFYVSAAGALRAVSAIFDGNVTVGGTLGVTGAITSPTVTTLTAADTALDTRLDTLEAQTLDTRVAAVETNLGSQTTFAATSAAKDAKRMHWGTQSGTADAGGFRVVTHGAGFTPSVVTITLSGAFAFSVDSVGATTFRVYISRPDDTPFNGYTGTINYFCGE